MATSSDVPGVHVVNHPLLHHALASLRLESTSSKEFRALVHNITTVLIVDATRSLPTTRVQGQGPLTTFTGDEVKQRIGIVPILRAGLGMVEASLALLPENTSVLHIGLFREKLSLQPVEYYSKLPDVPSVEQIIILDPLVATGGTVIVCVKMMLDWGIKMENIKFICVLGSQPGLKALADACPGLEIWTGAIDPTLSAEGMIHPGLGDTGDRLHATFAV